MAIVEMEPLVQPAQRFLTAADLETFPTELPSGPIDYELDNGRLVFIIVPPGDLHGAVQSNIATELKIQGERKGHGKARTEVGIVLWRNPDRVSALTSCLWPTSRSRSAAAQRATWRRFRS